LHGVKIDEFPFISFIYFFTFSPVKKKKQNMAFWKMKCVFIENENIGISFS